MPLILLVFLACDQVEDRGLRLAPEAEDPPTSQWSPGGVDDSGDPGGSPGTLVASAECGGEGEGEGGYMDGSDSLALDWCVRVTPEIEEEDAVDTGGGSLELPDDAAPPPCSFSNLVGAVRLAGDPADPLLLYCDSDEEGGMRTVTVGEGGVLTTHLLDPLACWTDPDSGALVQAEGGYDALYVDPTGAGVTADPVVVSLELDAAGGVAGSGQLVDVGTVPAALYRVDTASGERLLVRGREGALVLVDRAGDRREVLAEGISRVVGVALGEQLAVVACTSEGQLVVAGVDPSAPAWAPQVLDEAGCDATSRPTVATSGTSLLVGAHTATAGGQLILLDGALQVVANQSLGVDAVWPDVAWDGAGTRYATIDTTGQVRTWSGTLAPLGAWRHPMVAEHAGTLLGFRLFPGADRWAFVTLGLDSEPAAGGHMSTFYWVELSTSPAP